MEAGADGCGLNGGGNVEAGNLSDGGGGVAAEARMQRMEPRGLPFGFIGAMGARKPIGHLDLHTCHDLPP